MQSFLQHVTEPQRRRLESFLEAEVRVLGQDNYGSAVLAGAFLYGEEAFCGRLATRILQEPGLLITMAGMRHGHMAVLRLLNRVTAVELQDARAVLSMSREVLNESKFGCVVMAHL